MNGIKVFDYEGHHIYFELSNKKSIVCQWNLLFFQNILSNISKIYFLFRPSLLELVWDETLQHINSIETSKNLCTIWPKNAFSRKKIKVSLKSITILVIVLLLSYSLVFSVNHLIVSSVNLVKLVSCRLWKLVIQ